MSLFSKLVIASHNAGKVKEIGDLLKPLAIEVVSAGVLKLTEPEETGTSFVANAAIKSEAAAKASGLWALSDDSGLCVDAIGGDPGVYSADWAGPTKDFAAGMERIRQAIIKAGASPEGVKAHFMCVLSLTSPELITTSFEGRVDGRLTFPPRGDKGFGYDPIFIPEGLTTTFAEIEPLKKHSMSHRARAFAKFLAYLSGTGKGAL
jgi:XTP/dITP diphosphohydrolase